MSLTRRARRESARQQAQLRLRRLQARSHRRRRSWSWRGLPRLLWQRRTLAVVAALALAAIIAVPIFATGAPPATQTPDAEVSPTPGPTAKIYAGAPASVLREGSRYTATIQTAKGPLSVELYADAAQTAVNNFVFLARDNYYTSSTVTRADQNQRIQIGGRDGQAGPGYVVPLASAGGARPPRLGSLVAVDQGGGMGSEFAILLADPIAGQADHVFGRITSGLDVARQLQAGEKIQQVVVQELEAGSTVPREND